MKQRLLQSVLAFFLLTVFSLISVYAQASNASTTSLVTLTVRVGGNTYPIGATVVSNARGIQGNSLLILNGTSQTSNTFLALARSVVTSNIGVNRVMMLDYPIHGKSGFPTRGNPQQFGNLTIDDYVTVLISSLQQLRALGMGPTALMGHSLGAEVMQLAQTRLVNSGTSLRQAFGIKSAIFLVPDIAAPLTWSAIDAGVADPLAAAFGRFDPTLGTVFDLKTLPGGLQTFQGLFYADTGGNLVDGTPSTSQILANGFVTIESASMVAQLVGLPSTSGGARNPRPFISPNIFTSATGTNASVVWLAQDGLYQQTEHQAVYEYLTGDTSDFLFFIDTDSNSVHNIHTIIPSLYTGVIQTTLQFSN